jgi:CheY-like chemotaxis protein
MPTPSFPDLTLLVADESAHMRRIVREVVLRAGIRRVVEAADGAEAITLLAETSPDVVVLDWDLPVLSGEDFVRLTRTVKTSPAPRVPIVLTLADPRRSAVERAVCLGVNEIVAKPFSPATLWARLDEVVNRPRPFSEAGDLVRPEPRAGGLIT